MIKYDKINEEFGSHVRALRIREGCSQEGFAQEAGIDRSYYGRIERGEANPTLKNIAAIAEALGVAIPELFKELSKSTRRNSKV